MSRFAGRNVWLIGASHGIGAALAVKLAQAGANVALSGRDRESLIQVKEGLKGGNHLVVPLDVTNAASQELAVQGIADQWPHIDTVIYNAGTYDPMGAAEFSLDAVRRMIDVNLSGAFYLLKAVLPVFMRQQSGHLVLVGSVAGYRGLPNAMGYGASKAGLINLAESLRAELAPKNIRVQLVNPGFVRTRLTEKNNFPMPFAISAEEAAEAFLRGMEGNTFEIHFPRKFTCIMKLLSALPDALYFRITQRML